MIRSLLHHVFPGGQESVSSNGAVNGTASSGTVQTEQDGATDLMNSEPKISNSST